MAVTAANPPPSDTQPTPPVGPALSPWPLAGSAEFEAGDQAWRAATADRLRRDLVGHVIGPWFPRSMDEQAGGFRCNLDRRWRATGDDSRTLEFEARQTRTVARLGLAFPGESVWADLALHGLRYLRERMYDDSAGGWFWRIDPSGAPLDGATKHAHGTAYVIGAAVEVYRLTGEADALALADAAFEWLDAAAHDPAEGGYFGWLTRAGRPIMSSADLPPGVLREPLGHGLGLKDANVHSDLLEALVLLSETRVDATVNARLTEVYDLVRHRFTTPAGALHYLLHPDLTPVPGIERYGYLLQSSSRLPAAAAAIGASMSEAVGSLGLMLDHALEWAWDEQRGGFIEAGPATPPSWLGGVPLSVRRRPWWIQAEGANALLLAAVLEGRPTRHRALFERLLDVIERQFLDPRYGGWQSLPRSEWPPKARLPGRGLPKSEIWKDASHEAGFYLSAIRMLRGLAPTEAID